MPARGELSGGVDPSALRRQDKRDAERASQQTFSNFADQFIDKARKEGRAAATMTKTVWLLNMAKAEFCPRPIAEITAPDVLTVLKRVEAKGNYETAKRLRAKIGAVCRYAVANGAAEIDPTYAL